MTVQQMDCVKLHSHHPLPLPSLPLFLQAMTKKNSISLALINWTILSSTDPFTTSVIDDPQWLEKQISFSLLWHLHNHKLSPLHCIISDFPYISYKMDNVQQCRWAVFVPEPSAMECIVLGTCTVCWYWDGVTVLFCICLLCFSLSVFLIIS